MDKKIEIYTDGSSLGNPGPGGWGVVVVEENKIIKEIGGGEKNTTNNRMELQAAIEALKFVHQNKFDDVTIHADSAYVLGGVTTWIHGWERNGWKTANKKPVLNQELWQELVSLERGLKIKINWQKVKGHSGHIYNDKADEVATSNAALYQKQ
jgi:ribonuclease HI